MNSKLHTQKTIITVGEFADMVKNMSWKREVSYIIEEDYDSKSGKWKEDEKAFTCVDKVYSLVFDEKKGTLSYATDRDYYSFAHITGSTRIEELVTNNEELRITIYTT